ncbi:hypothetical protein HLRTI_002100 [Halorhabdus tiamatea SARL4B]|uniref:Uncharacterized protein n=1 Tax=Halorhabdus tiamatea SARL4B TaxID=1033806 RepID=F7PL74_9EURY|nr:hypothetical protein [Halorhabdus tiamatea]ERJ05829.1 hypothetical protein HLRTI_002100 [Halorhabdus tiamatea SARL4B]CCQ34489.1 conserved hypothetical protein [Halorhabdus tiamatea SARL4B]
MTWIGPPVESRIRSVESTVRRAILVTGFWGAIALPLVGLPVLAVVPATADVVAFGLVANVVCLVVGQRHEPSARWGTASRESPPVGEGSR